VVTLGGVEDAEPLHQFGVGVDERVPQDATGTVIEAGEELAHEGDS